MTKDEILEEISKALTEGKDTDDLEFELLQIELKEAKDEND